MPPGGGRVVVVWWWWWRWVMAVMVVAVMVTPSSPHLTWTPILPDSPDQVDLWTVSGSGCACPHNPTAQPRQCACCLARAACHCGQANPHRCAQCGLQQYCNNMCNVTIDGVLLLVTSGRLSGSLISPGDLASPAYCWYKLRAPPGHRVEIQLHRLVHVGNFVNTTTCRGGRVEVVGGRNDLAALTLCGEDERLHPPAVIYTDSGQATITFQVSQEWGSPRFIAYYNFPHKTHADTGDHQKGGTRLQYTACDWVYQDVHCSEGGGGCRLTSPGYPGLYPAHARCRYLLAMSSPSARGSITFISLDLHPQRCSTDYVAVYAGTSTSSPLIDSLCGSQTRTINFSGPSVLVDFSSGPRVPLYKYCGFLASVTFSGVAGVPDPSALTVTSSPLLPSNTHPHCHKVFRSNHTREGIFDTLVIAPGSRTCSICFFGDPGEVVQVSLYKYNLGGRNCASAATIHDGLSSNTSEHLGRMCSPARREARDATGKFLQPEFYLSSGNTMEVTLTLGQNTPFLSQFLVGGFHFHNSLLEGTKNPSSVCDVMFYGAHTPSKGTLHQPSTSLLWNVEGPLNCSYLFVPTSTQAMAVTVMTLGESDAPRCQTHCDAEGCQCHPSPTVPLRDIDHILIVHSPSRRILHCYCGVLKEAWDVLVEGGGGVDVIYHVAHFTWTTPGVNFTLHYTFTQPTFCGPTYHNSLAGEVGPRNHTASTSEHLYASCTWVINFPPAAALALTLTPPRQGSCSTWNVSVESTSRGGGGVGETLRGGACASHPTTLLNVPTHHLSASITLEVWGSERRDWLITWNTHWPRPAPPTSVSPKPESSRTVNLHPTRRTFLVQQSSGGKRRREMMPVMLLCVLEMLVH